MLITGRAQKRLQLYTVDPRQLNLHERLAVDHSVFDCTEPDSVYEHRLAATEVDLEDAGNGTISDYEWLVGTRPIDPDDNQLYAVSRVGTVQFRQTEYIVDYRTFLNPNGLVFSKVEPEAIHIEDLVRITNGDEGFQAPSNQRGKRSRPDQADPHLSDDLDGGRLVA